MGSPGLRRWLLCAASVALAACAASPMPAVPESAYRPVPRSTLVSRADPAFVQAQVRDVARSATVLARRQPSSAPVPVAVIRYASEGGDALVSVQFLPDRSSPEADVLALEQLYALMLRQEGQGRYCLAVGAQPCDPARHGGSHEALLRQLAGERTRAASVAGGALAITPWRSISMSAAAAPAANRDDVAVQVVDESRPMTGATVYFNRAPHSGCAATVGGNGVAACRLVDQHGDDGAHADDDAHARVLVTFPGDVRADRVLLPTTYVLPARRN